MPPLKKSMLDDPEFGKPPRWLKVGLGLVLMTTVGMLALGAWALVEIVQWVTSK